MKYIKVIAETRPYRGNAFLNWRYYCDKYLKIFMFQIGDIDMIFKAKIN